MKLVSINVSPPIKIIHNNKTIMTGIFKKPVEGPVYASELNLAGDGQADLKNHGGVDKAIYAYSYDHYVYWERTLNRHDFDYGQFGENLTVSGLDESKLYIGDQLQAGEAIFTITQPRVPCFKLGIRFGDKHMPKKFMQAALTGIYLKVVKEGYLQAGDDLNVIKQDENRVSVKNLFTAFYLAQDDNSLGILRDALHVTDLSQAWRRQIEKRLTGNINDDPPKTKV
jgi:MOSC domain-containing protein YiiM